jgi:hypothetical protein
MTRLRFVCTALAAVSTFAVLGQSTTAHADPPSGPPAASAAPAPTAAGGAVVVAIAEKAATTSTSTSMGTVMIVLDVLGLVEKGAPKGAARAHAAVRTPIWLQPEPPKTPLFYSSLVVAKF